MFIKFTRSDGTPIWLNAAFVVTVEPKKNGGSIVVPIGDGLDYEVRESVEQVLSLLGETPPVAVVAVPAPHGLAPQRPDDLAPEMETAQASPLEELESKAVSQASEDFQGEEKSRPLKKSTAKRVRKGATKGKSEVAASETSLAREVVDGSKENGAQGEESRVSVVTTQTVLATEDADDVFAHSTAVVPGNMTPEVVARLQRMSPRTMPKLLNTLRSQFRTHNPEAAVEALVSLGALTILEDGRLEWKGA